MGAVCYNPSALRNRNRTTGHRLDSILEGEKRESFELGGSFNGATNRAERSKNSAFEAAEFETSRKSCSPLAVVFASGCMAAR